PRRISAPSSTACCAPCCAPCGLPVSSLTRSWMLGFWNSASAISAALFIDCAATPALPEAESGRIRPTLTWPLPTAVGCCAGPAGAVGVSELENWPRLCWTPAQAESRGAPSRRPSAVRRVAVTFCDPVGSDCDLRRPCIASLGLTDRDRPGLPPFQRSEGGFRHIVGE